METRLPVTSSAISPDSVSSSPESEEKISIVELQGLITELSTSILNASAEDAETRILLVGKSSTMLADYASQRAASNSILAESQRPVGSPPRKLTLKQKLAKACEALFKPQLFEELNKIIQQIIDFSSKIAQEYSEHYEDYALTKEKHEDRLHNQLRELEHELNEFKSIAKKHRPSTLAAEFKKIIQKVQAKKNEREDELKKYDQQSTAYQKAQASYNLIHHKAKLICDELQAYLLNANDAQLPFMVQQDSALNAAALPVVSSAALPSTTKKSTATNSLEQSGQVIPAAEIYKELNQWFKQAEKLTPLSVLPKHVSLTVEALTTAYNNALHQVILDCNKLKNGTTWSYIEITKQVAGLRKSKIKSSSIKPLMLQMECILKKFENIIREFEEFSNSDKLLDLSKQITDWVGKNPALVEGFETDLLYLANGCMLKMAAPGMEPAANIINLDELKRIYTTYEKQLKLLTGLNETLKVIEKHLSDLKSQEKFAYQYDKNAYYLPAADAAEVSATVKLYHSITMLVTNIMQISSVKQQENEVINYLREDGSRVEQSSSGIKQACKDLIEVKKTSYAVLSTNISSLIANIRELQRASLRLNTNYKATFKAQQKSDEQKTFEVFEAEVKKLHKKLLTLEPEIAESLGESLLETIRKSAEKFQQNKIKAERYHAQAHAYDGVFEQATKILEDLNKNFAQDKHVKIDFSLAGLTSADVRRKGSSVSAANSNLSIDASSCASSPLLVDTVDSSASASLIATSNVTVSSSSASAVPGSVKHIAATLKIPLASMAAANSHRSSMGAVANPSATSASAKTSYESFPRRTTSVVDTSATEETDNDDFNSHAHAL